MEAQNIMYANLLSADDVADVLLQCALQMKIPILRSTWVTECHAIWKQGDDVDLREVPPTPTAGATSTYIRSRSRASCSTDFLYSLSS
jgi:hypothetical protein